MPTYLTPGVYVEEVPSANKPIEGVSTSIAAFVGLAPGGPVNTPMRISNWTQFAKIYGDPNEPDNGPFMDGAYLAHSVYGFFQNGGTTCWIVRVGDDGGSNGRGAAAARRAAGGHRRLRRGVRGRRARTPARTRSPSRSSEEPTAGEGADKTYTVKVSPGSDNEEFTGPVDQEGPHEPRHQGQRAVQADQDRGDRRGPARGAARPGDRHCSSCRPRRSTRRKVKPHALRGRRRPAQGHGRPGRRRRDHDGRAAGHHATSLGDDGDDSPVP